MVFVRGRKLTLSIPGGCPPVRLAAEDVAGDFSRRLGIEPVLVEDESYSWRHHPDRLTACWEAYIQRLASFKNVVWTIGYKPGVDCGRALTPGGRLCGGAEECQPGDRLFEAGHRLAGGQWGKAFRRLVLR